MKVRLGEILYRLFCGLAVLSLLCGLLVISMNPINMGMAVGFFAALVAGSYLIGRACRHFLAGR